jgi:hypothetical protein
MHYSTGELQKSKRKPEKQNGHANGFFRTEELNDGSEQR